MLKKTLTKKNTAKRRKARKIGNLPARSVKGGQAVAVKGGLMEEEGIYYYQHR